MHTASRKMHTLVGLWVSEFLNLRYIYIGADTEKSGIRVAYLCILPDKIRT